MKEADIQTAFTKNIEEIKSELSKINNLGNAFELKIEKSKRFTFTNVKDHQIANLKSVKNGGCYHKISDSPIFNGMRSRFTVQKPFDCFILKGNAFVVICWYKERTKKELHFIDIDDFVEKKETSKMKSMTYEESKEISKLTYDLNVKSRKTKN